MTFKFLRFSVEDFNFLDEIEKRSSEPELYKGKDGDSFLTTKESANLILLTRKIQNEIDFIENAGICRKILFTLVRG